MKITNEMVERAVNVWHRTQGTGQENWYLNPINRERMRAALEAALTHPCTCREDVACGACMSGATDPATATTPPADDVREAPCTCYGPPLPDHWRGCPAASWNAGKDYSGEVIPTIEEWSEQMDAERARQIEHGYDDAHDAEHGTAHLLNWVIDYARRGNNLAAATMARCAVRMPHGTVTSEAAKEVAVTRAYNEVTGADDEGWNPDRTLTALNTLWDAAREAQR